jgi:hypothetical protein
MNDYRLHVIAAILNVGIAVTLITFLARLGR